MKDALSGYSDRLIVKVVCPLDNFGSWTKRLEDCLQGMSEDQRTELMARFMQASIAVSRHEWWDWVMREEPRIGYNPKADDFYFIFKLDNNGTTFLVGYSVPEYYDDFESERIEVSVAPLPLTFWPS